MFFFFFFCKCTCSVIVLVSLNLKECVCCRVAQFKCASVENLVTGMDSSLESICRRCVETLKAFYQG